jgi:polar amino acid transport system substrate-binding protein
LRSALKTLSIVGGLLVESENNLQINAVILSVMVCGGVALGARPSAGAESAPFIPSFWDPRATADKPDLDSIKAIRFVTGNDFPPFDFTLPGGSVAGFNVDLARAICDELQVTCTIQARPWAALRGAVTGGQADAAIASMSIDEHAADLAFTGAYYRTPARFLVPQPSGIDPEKLESFEGKRVGVEAGTAHEAYLVAFFPRQMIKTYPRAEAARAALKAGEIDAVFGDAVGEAIWLSGNDAAGCCAFAGGPYTETRYFGPGAGIAVRKSDTELRQLLDYALARVAAKGVYADLYLRYFPVGFY